MNILFKSLKQKAKEAEKCGLWNVSETEKKIRIISLDIGIATDRRKKTRNRTAENIFSSVST